MPADIRDFGEKAVNFFQNLLVKSVFANFCQVQLHTSACHYCYSILCVKTFNLNIPSQVDYYNLPAYWFKINLSELSWDWRRMQGFLDRLHPHPAKLRQNVAEFLDFQLR